jgi:uncharacterized iron-regulated membrane protein
MKANTIKYWFYIHKWTSLICTIFLLLLCLTGLPLIFTDEIQDLMDKDPDAPVISTQIQHVSIDHVIQNAEAHLPGKSVKYIFRDEDKEPGKLFFTLGDSTQKDRYLTMDGRTGAVLATPVEELDFMKVMYHLHVDLMAGLPGMLFLGAMGILFFVAIVSGIVLYGPIMKRYDFGMIRTERVNRLQWLDLHNMIGIVSLSWATVVGLTGVINTLADPAMDAWRAGQLKEMVADYKNATPLSGNMIPLEVAIKKVKEAVPDMEPSFIAFPGTLYSSQHHYAVYLVGHTPLTSRIFKPALIDAQTGALTAIRSLPWYLQAVYISQPFHFGDYGGMPLKIIWAIFDLVTILVLISGIYLWVVRLKSKKQQLNRMMAHANVLEK